MGIVNGWNNIALITPPGDIDIASVPVLRDRIDALIGGGTLRILINCQSVEFIDSSGMALLLSRSRMIATKGGLLSLADVSPQVLRFLQIARLVDALHATGAKRDVSPLPAADSEPVSSTTLAVREGIENLAYYRHRVVEMLESTVLPRDACFDVALAVGEALGNVYDHAGASGATMSVQIYSDRAVIDVCDCGEGYQIASDEEPEQSVERGRGIKLMRMLVDSVEVRRRTDADGTLVTLVKLFNE